MMKKFLVILIILMFVVAGIGIAFLLYMQSQDNSENGGTDSSASLTSSMISESVDIVERDNQYSMLYNLSLNSGVTLDCGWKGVSFTWDYPDIKKVPVYQASSSLTEIDVSSDNKQTFSNEKKAVSDFFSSQPDVNSTLSYDYVVEIVSKDTNAMEKMPLFSTVNGEKILTSTLGVWRDLEGEYIAGLYEAEAGFHTYQFDENHPWFFISNIGETRAKEMIVGNAVEFLNHEFFCEDKDVIGTEVTDIETVYLPSGDDTLIPVYKVNGIFETKSRNIDWTLLVDLIDYTQLDYTIYDDSQADIQFIPRPFISEVHLSKGDYTVKGKLPVHLSRDLDVTEYSELNVDIKVTEETGSYVYGERKEALLQEIKDSLEVSNDGSFSFSFSADNFWKVETLIYEDEEGNELDEPIHSSVNEQNRFDYDNTFQITTCSKFNDNEYCSEASNIYYLEVVEG